MNFRLLILIILSPALFFVSSAQAENDQAKQEALMEAYPGLFTFSGNNLIWNDGSTIVWDDGKSKTPAELIENPDLEDMFKFSYPLASEGPLAPAKDFDPGRIRHEGFLKKLYGSSEKEVDRRVVRVPWLPKLGKDHINVTTAFDIDKKIAAISADLELLPKQFHKYILKPAGGFTWRLIAKSDKLSVHSFGAAVDINTDFTDYWGWEKIPASGLIPYANRIPLEIVAIFERHGFIWGGRWYHYDSMHFECRPELITLRGAHVL